MALKNLFDMVKADRYTADGCEVLNKAREADVEDRVYNIGEISQKTGLQKTANGWVKPKKGGAGTEKNQTLSNSESKPKMTPEQKSKWEAKAANSSETTASLRNFISSMSKPEAKANPHADEIVEIYKKELAKRENNPGYRPEKVYSESKPADENAKMEDVRKQLLELEKQRRSYKDDTAENYAGHNIRLKQAALLRQAGFNGRSDFDKYLREKMPTDSAPRILTGDTRIRVRKA